MINRGYKINSYDNMYNYFKDRISYEEFVSNLQHLDTLDFKPYVDYHNDRYLLQNFFNLQEKYDRHQSDFYYDVYNRLLEFIRERFKNYDILNLLK